MASRTAQLRALEQRVRAIEERLGMNQTSTPPPEAEGQDVTDPELAVKLAHNWNMHK